MDCPQMASDASGDRRCPAEPASPVVRQIERHAQALVVRAEVVHRAYQIHRVVQGGCLAGQRPASTNQRCDMRPKGRIQALDVSGIDQPTALGRAQQGFDVRLGSLYDATRHSHHVLVRILLDHLGNVNAVPRSQWRMSSLPIADGFSEHVPDSAYVCCTSIDAEQQRTTQSTMANPLDQSDDQLHIPGCAEHTPQPQACLHLDRHGHPENAALDLGPNLVCLHLPQVTRLLYQELVHTLAVLPRPCLPTQHRTLIQAKGRDNGLQVTTVSQQSHDNDHQVFGGPQPIEHGALGYSECLATHVALATPFLQAMDADVSLADLSTCGTSGIGAK